VGEDETIVFFSRHLTCALSSHRSPGWPEESQVNLAVHFKSKSNPYKSIDGVQLSARLCETFPG
jgi:hypothetical protein